MRTTVDLEDEAYLLAKSMAQDSNTSLGKVISKLIINRVKDPDVGFVIRTSPKTGLPTFRSVRRTSTEDVKALEDEF